MACQAAATDIQNNMPTKPSAPNFPDFGNIDSDVTLPAPPVYSPPKLSLSFNAIVSKIATEDFDSADKQLEVFDKQVSLYEKQYEREEKYYQKELETFNSELDNKTKNVDREFQIAAGQYRSEIYKYQYDISKHNADVQEALLKYKWFIEQYVSNLNEYNKGIMMTIGEVKKPTTQEKLPKQQQQVSEQETPIEQGGGVY